MKSENIKADLAGNEAGAVRGPTSRTEGHDCVERINAQLAGHNTMLSWTIGALGREGELIQVTTCKADHKKRGRPTLMFASYCPFCGVKLRKDEA